MNFDTDTPQGKFFFSVVGAFAELEREITRERIMAGIERARKENKHLGRYLPIFCHVNSAIVLQDCCGASPSGTHRIIP